jgi:ribose 5-phosphate isomerase B
MKKLLIAADHAGFNLKQELIERFKSKVQIEDLGTSSTESCDYPLFAKKLSDRMLEEMKNFPNTLGLLICGTGSGMAIAANKIKGIRATCASEPETARMAREHNNAHILSLGGRILSVDQAEKCLQTFLDAKFDTANPRHQRRIDQITSFEK